VFISKTLHRLYAYKTVSGWRRQKNHRTDCWPPAEGKEDSDNTDIWDRNPHFVTQRSLAMPYTVTSVEVCVTLDVQLRWDRGRTGTFLRRSGKTSALRLNSADKRAVPYWLTHESWEIEDWIKATKCVPATRTAVRIQIPKTLPGLLRQVPRLPGFPKHKAICTFLIPF